MTELLLGQERSGRKQQGKRFNCVNRVPEPTDLLQLFDSTPIRGWMADSKQYPRAIPSESGQRHSHEFPFVLLSLFLDPQLRLCNDL